VWGEREREKEREREQRCPEKLGRLRLNILQVSQLLVSPILSVLRSVVNSSERASRNQEKRAGTRQP
jgi:hypothetical protein